MLASGNVFLVNGVCQFTSFSALRNFFLSNFNYNMIIHVNKQAYTEDFAAGILDSLAVELKGSKDFSKLATGISILGYIASVKEPINSRSFSQLLSFLGHRYPKVRCNLMIDFG